jgi:hypothetical protein
MKPKYWAIIILALVAATAVGVYFIENRPQDLGPIVVPHHNIADNNAGTQYQTYVSPLFHYSMVVPVTWQTNDVENTFLDSSGNPILYMESIYLPQTMTTMANLKIQDSALGWEDKDPEYKNISFEKFSEDQNSVIYISEWQDTTMPGNAYFLRADMIQKNQVVFPWQNYPKGDITVLTITSVDNTPTTMPFDDMAVFKKIIASFQFPENVNDPKE